MVEFFPSLLMMKKVSDHCIMFYLFLEVEYSEFLESLLFLIIIMFWQFAEKLYEFLNIELESELNVERSKYPFLSLVFSDFWVAYQ